MYASDSSRSHRAKPLLNELEVHREPSSLAMRLQKAFRRCVSSVLPSSTRPFAKFFAGGAAFKPGSLGIAGNVRPAAEAAALAAAWLLLLPRSLAAAWALPLPRACAVAYCAVALVEESSRPSSRASHRPGGEKAAISAGTRSQPAL